MLHVPQAQLEDVLFSIVRAKGFDEAHIDCYRMVTQFYQSRQPLCIIICGAAWTGVWWQSLGFWGLVERVSACFSCGGSAWTRLEGRAGSWQCVLLGLEASRMDSRALFATHVLILEQVTKGCG
jgi:hypothetical protein